jgi:hypothetical protein
MSAALPWHACIDGSNIDADIDDGGNAGLVNGGAV